jgi:hypothetical protein
MVKLDSGRTTKIGCRPSGKALYLPLIHFFALTFVPLKQKDKFQVFRNMLMQGKFYMSEMMASHLKPY